MQLRKALEKEFSLKIPIATFKKVHTAGETIDYVKKAVEQASVRCPRQAGRPLPAPELTPPTPPDAPVAPYPYGGRRATQVRLLVAL